MKTSDYFFNLPSSLIAQTPGEKRGKDLLLVIDRKTGKYIDSNFENFADFVEPSSLIVINDTKVRKARVYAFAETGSKVEFLFTEAVSDKIWRAIVSKSKKQKIGKKYFFYTLSGNLFCTATIIAESTDNNRESSIKEILFDRIIDESFFLSCGHIPLPPYIKRDDNLNDEERYQTIYAKEYGSMAAPTAGLHITEQTFDKLKEKKIEVVNITLQVGLGTFLPIRTDNLDNHIMHTEQYFISEQTATAVNKAKKEGRKIIAIGTTSVRTLESAFNEKTGMLVAGNRKTNLFIKPGFKFKLTDQILTNFHTPQSTLLILVSAFAGKENIFRAYEHAIKKGYKFFSYGDATFIR